MGYLFKFNPLAWAALLLCAFGCVRVNSPSPSSRLAEDVGGLTKEEIEGVIRANLAQIKACYEKNLQGNRDLAGRIFSDFVIGSNGVVKTSRVASSPR